MSDAAIQVRDLEHAYGDHKAVDGITFEVAPGEVTILGKNRKGNRAEL